MTLTLTVMDNAGATNAKTASVTVTAPTGNVPPLANFSSTANGLTARFTDNSSDRDGTIASRASTFGDGGTSTVANPGHTYAAAGTYSAMLTVTDNAGATNARTVPVTVTAPTNNAPTALQNGVAVTGLAAASGNDLLFTLDVPAGATGLKFASSGGNGDADLYVKFNGTPTLSSYDCVAGASTSADETCSIATARAGTYPVMVHAYTAFSGVRQAGSYAAGGSVLQNGVAVTACRPASARTRRPAPSSCRRAGRSARSRRPGATVTATSTSVSGLPRRGGASPFASGRQSGYDRKEAGLPAFLLERSATTP